MASTPTGPLTGSPGKIRVSTKGASPLFTPKEPPPPGVEPPIAISQPMPQWSPRGLAARQNYNGVIEVTIDEQRNVMTVALQQPMHPVVDKALAKAARTWKYKPALLNGHACLVCEGDRNSDPTRTLDRVIVTTLSFRRNL